MIKWEHGGPGLYQDDVTCDIKDGYIDRLKVGYSNNKAKTDLIERNLDFISDSDDAPLFWFALADTQWKYGRLDADVKEKALEYIENQENLEIWKEENPKQYLKRKKVLEELKERLNSPMPPEKKMSKLKPQKAKFKVGDILLYQINCYEIPENFKINPSFEDDRNFIINSKWYNKYILLRVIGKSTWNIGSLPREYDNETDIVAIYNWVGDKEPNLEIIEKLEFIPNRIDFKRGNIKPTMQTLSFTRKEWKDLDFKVLKEDSNYKDPKDHIMSGIGILWQNIYTIDYSYVLTLDFAEEQGILIDETKK